VHARVLELLEGRVGELRVARALDPGCGAGLSTRVLRGRASLHFLKEHYSQIPRTTLQYAIEHLPLQQRKLFLLEISLIN